MLELCDGSLPGFDGSDWLCDLRSGFLHRIIWCLGLRRVRCGYLPGKLRQEQLHELQRGQVLRQRFDKLHELRRGAEPSEFWLHCLHVLRRGQVLRSGRDQLRELWRWQILHSDFWFVVPS